MQARTHTTQSESNRCLCIRMMMLPDHMTSQLLDLYKSIARALSVDGEEVGLDLGKTGEDTRKVRSKQYSWAS